MSKKPPLNPPGTAQGSPLLGPGTRLADKAASQDAQLCVDRDEMVARSTSPIKEVEAAKRYLERKCMTIVGEEYTTKSLSLTLLHMTQAKGVGRDAIDGMRAVALILEGLQVEEEARQQSERMDEIAEMMEKKCVSLVDSVAMAMGQMLEEAEGKVRDLVEVAAKMVQTSPSIPATYAVVAATVGEAHPNGHYNVPSRQPFWLGKMPRQSKSLLMSKMGVQHCQA